MNRIAANPMVMRALGLAEEKLGLQQLSQRLSTPGVTVQAWRDGHAVMPQHRFLRLVDLLTALDPDWAAEDNLRGAGDGEQGHLSADAHIRDEHRR